MSARFVFLDEDGSEKKIEIATGVTVIKKQTLLKIDVYDIYTYFKSKEKTLKD